MALKLPVLKWILLILNFLLPIFGVALIALSVLELNASTPGSITHFTIVIQIFVGALVVLTAFLGCYATCRISLGLLCSYGICLIILLALHVYIIIIAVNASPYAQDANHFETIWSNHTLHAQQIARIQQTYQCCGRLGAQDYVLMGTAIPGSCYKQYERLAQHLFSDGCLEPLQTKAIYVEQWGFFIKWALFFIEILAFIFASLMANTIHNQQRRAQF